MSKIARFCTRTRNVAFLLGLTTAWPALAACPADTFADQFDFSHVDVDPGADGAEDRGGWAVATNGEVVASGTRGNINSSTHYVYLYQRGATPDQWSYLKRLEEPDPPASVDGFGEVVAMDGDTLVAGATNAVGTHGNAVGAVFVFQKNQGGANTWGARQTINVDYYDGFRDFGGSVDIHRNRMLVGDTGNAVFRAVVYERSSANADFVAVAELRPPPADLADSSFFAAKVALYGDVAVVSDPFFKTDSDSFTRGRVYVYARDQGGAGQWGLVTTLLSPDSSPPNGTVKFGWAISMWGSDDQTRGETIAASNTDQDGHVFLFRRDAGGADNWGQVADLEPEDTGSGGFVINSLHLHSNELLVGAPEATGIASGTGAVYVYHRQLGGVDNWGQSQKFFSQTNDSNSNYGFSMDWSAGVAVVGDPLAYTYGIRHVGHTYILFDDLIFCDPFE